MGTSTSTNAATAAATTTTKKKAPPQPPPKIVGWKHIAAATGRAINQSVSVRTARRWAQQGRALRLPVYKYPNGLTYMLVSHLRLFALSWSEGLPLGGKPTISAN